MGLNFNYKKGYSYKSDFIHEQSPGALTPSDIQFLQNLGYKVLSKYGTSTTAATKKKRKQQLIEPSCCSKKAKTK